MKLSEIKGERTYDVIADLIDPILLIASDEQASTLFKREKCPDGVEPEKFAIDKIRKGVPSLVKAHKTELSTILATLNGITVEEYNEALTIPRLIHDVLDLLTDTEFLSFFG